MAIDRDVTYGIVKSLSEFWRSEELTDLTVICELVHFKCHRFLLAACSGYFRDLFRSKEKEIDLKYVTINNIRSKTFSSILQSLYTGQDVLTNYNVINMWHAVNQLQIKFLITKCDEFVYRSLSLVNYEDYLHHANIINNQHIQKFIWKFVTHNFDSFSNTKSFLEIPIVRLLELLKSQHLKVLNEDVVIKSIFRWLDHHTPQVRASQHSLTRQTTQQCFEVNFENLPPKSKNIKLDNVDSQVADKAPTIAKESVVETDRLADDLLSLLSAARPDLCSLEVLRQALQYPLVIHSHKAQDIILKAVLNKLERHQNGDQGSLSASKRNLEQPEAWEQHYQIFRCTL